MIGDERLHQAAGLLLRDLAKARQSGLLYPPGHPHRMELGRGLVELATTMQERSSGDPSVFVDRGGFYIGATLLPRESLALGKLVEDFERVGIESLTFAPGVTAADFDELLAVLAEQRGYGAGLGSLRINAVRPVYRHEGPWEERLIELRRAYAGGVSVLRDSSAAMAAGKPVDLDAALATVRNLHSQVEDDPGYGLLLSAMKSYDEYTYFHMVNVCLLSVALGQLVGLRRDQVMVLGLGGLLHDIGKVFVPQDVLSGTGRLDEEQWRLIQRHPVDGAGMLLATGEGLYHPAAAILLEHHAAYDRSGYPSLHDHGPSVPSRMVAVADSFDAVTSRRSYREPMDRHRGLQLLASAAGHGLDPAAVAAFHRLLGRYPVGSLVELTSGEVAVVVRPGQRPSDQPTVLVLLDATQTPVEVEERDLEAQPDGAAAIAGRLDPEALGLDLPRFVASGRVHELVRTPEHAGGLVHEPAPSETTPPGYVDTHAHAHGHEHPHPGGRPDPDVAPPIGE